MLKATFEGSFREGQEQAMTLNEEDGIVSLRSFKLLVQWMYLGKVIFGDLSATESLDAAVELARNADLYGVTGMEVRMAEYIKALINDSSPPFDYEFDSNTYLIDSKHIASAVQLPQEHPVRKILAAASVRDYFDQDKHKFAKEATEIPGFAVDLLEAVKDALKNLIRGQYEVSTIDPISGRQIKL